MSGILNNPNDPGRLSRFGIGQTPNPFYNISNQFLPRNYQDVIRWSRYILTQSPTIAEVVRKLSTYPITDFSYDTKNPAVIKNYKKIVKSLALKSKLDDIGFDYHTLGNVFVSIYFPIKRILTCSQCGAHHNADQVHDGKKIKFVRYTFRGICPTCDSEASFAIKDVKSKDINQINLVKWSVEHVVVDYNPITGNYRYYYRVPADVKKKIQQGDPLYVNSIPWSMIEAVQKNQDYEFDNSNIFHLKNISMGSILNGLGVPPLISLYSTVFYQAMLKKANEAVATERLTSMRVLHPVAQTGASDPVTAFAMRNFVDKMEDAMKKFKLDPNHVVISPVPVGAVEVGGNGRVMLAAQELQMAEESILIGLGVSRELLSGTTNWTSSTVGLRLLSNTLNNYVRQIEELIQWVFEKVSSYLDIPYAEVTLIPFKLTDDTTLQQALPALMEKGHVSISSTLKAFGIDLADELKQIREEAVAIARAGIEQEHEVNVAKFLFSKEVNNSGQDDNGYAQSMEKAYEEVQRIMAIGNPQTQQEYLLDLQVRDKTLYGLVTHLLEQYQENAQYSPAAGPMTVRNGMMEGVQNGQDPAAQNNDGASQQPTSSSQNNAG